MAGKGRLTVEGVDHHAYREVYGDGAMSGDLVLERDGASWPAPRNQAHSVTSSCWKYQRQRYTLRGKSAWTRTMLLDGERVLGTLALKSPWTRRTTVALPDDWPLPVKVFVAWLGIVLRKREWNE